MFNCTQLFYDDIWNAEEGRLINISSVVGKQGNFGQATTPPRKRHVGFTRTIALELAQGGSTANCVAPGFTATDMLGSVPDEVLDRIIAGIPARAGWPMSRTSRPSFGFTSEDSSYVTGRSTSTAGWISEILHGVTSGFLRADNRASGNNYFRTVFVDGKCMRSSQ